MVKWINGYKIEEIQMILKKEWRIKLMKYLFTQKQNNIKIEEKNKKKIKSSNDNDYNNYNLLKDYIGKEW